MPTPKLSKHLGCSPDPADGRDLRLPRLLMHLGIAAPLPTNVDVFKGLKLPVYEQGELGSCTANAGVLYRRFLAQRFAAYSVADQDLSRLFLYYQERKLLGWISQDEGANVRTLCQVLTKVGVCPESADPYVVSKFADAAVNDNQKVEVMAAMYRVGAYHRVLDVATARSALASGYAVLYGTALFESFEDIGSNGLMPLPASSEIVIGGHATVIHGYDDTRKVFIVRNSWGAGWGDGGDFYVPYAFVEDAQRTTPDMWIAHMGKPWKPKTV